jgi:hypothetical protein
MSALPYSNSWELLVAIVIFPSSPYSVLDVTVAALDQHYSLAGTLRHMPAAPEA